MLKKRGNGKVRKNVFVFGFFWVFFGGLVGWGADGNIL
jgi:hypothetical protein